MILLLSRSFRYGSIAIIQNVLQHRECARSEFLGSDTFDISPFSTGDNRTMHSLATSDSDTRREDNPRADTRGAEPHGFRWCSAEQIPRGDRLGDGTEAALPFGQGSALGTFKPQRTRLRFSLTRDTVEHQCTSRISMRDTISAQSVALRQSRERFSSLIPPTNLSRVL